MNFTVVQRLPFSADRVARAFTEPDLYRSFSGLTKVDVPEIVDRQVSGDEVRLWIRYRFHDRLDGAVKAVIDPGKLTWIDDSVHDLAAGTVRFVLHPDHYAERLRCHGTYSIVDDDGGCRRVGDIDVDVSLPLVGRAVEGAIESGLREHLAEESSAITRYLEAAPPA